LLRCTVAIVTALIASSTAVRAQDLTRDLAAGQTGTIYFSSVTPQSRWQLRHRKYDPAPAVISGMLFMPKAAHGKIPAMIIAPGSSGVGKKDLERWVPLFTNGGIAAFVVDSFTQRGIVSTSEDQSLLSPAANDADALAALKLLATHPLIDRDRIGIIGFSRGGATALATALDRFRRGMIDDDLKFAAHVAFYPPCGLRYWAASNPTTGAPIMMALGEKDDYTPITPCLDYASEMKRLGVDVSTIVYPNAYHGFDGVTNFHAWAPRVQQSAKCPQFEIDIDTWEYRLLSTGERFKTLKALEAAIGQCRSTGATVGSNRAAAKKAEQDVMEFLTKAFRR
jgi:dienelactone hydrolase